MCLFQTSRFFFTPLVLSHLLLDFILLTQSYSVMSETGTAARINQKLYIIIIIIIIIINIIIIIIIIINNNNFI